MLCAPDVRVNTLFHPHSQSFIPEKVAIVTARGEEERKRRSTCSGHDTPPVMMTHSFLQDWSFSTTEIPRIGQLYSSTKTVISSVNYSKTLELIRDKENVKSLFH